MPPSAPVQLTRVHYYDTNRSQWNLEVPTISQKIFKGGRVVKKRSFGGKMILSINEQKVGDKKQPPLAIGFFFTAILFLFAVGLMVLVLLYSKGMYGLLNFKLAFHVSHIFVILQLQCSVIKSNSTAL